MRTLVFWLGFAIGGLTVVGALTLWYSGTYAERLDKLSRDLDDLIERSAAAVSSPEAHVP